MRLDCEDGIDEVAWEREMERIPKRKIDPARRRLITALGASVPLVWATPVIDAVKLPEHGTASGYQPDRTDKPSGLPKSWPASWPHPRDWPADKTKWPRSHHEVIPPGWSANTSEWPDDWLDALTSILPPA